MSLTPGDLLTVSQVLKILPLGRSTIYGLVARGALPSYRPGAAGGGRGRILIHRTDLEAFIERSRAGDVA